MMDGRVAFLPYKHEFGVFEGDEWGYGDIADKDLTMQLAKVSTICQVEHLRSVKMIRAIRKYGLAKMRSASVAADDVRALERDLLVLDTYAKEKSNDPKKIGTLTVALRKRGRPALVKELNAAKRRLGKENLAIYKLLKEFE